jgi:hypothetical protein
MCCKRAAKGVRKKKSQICKSGDAFAGLIGAFSYNAECGKRDAATVDRPRKSFVLHNGGVALA